MQLLPKGKWGGSINPYLMCTEVVETHGLRHSPEGGDLWHICNTCKLRRRLHVYVYVSNAHPHAQTHARVTCVYCICRLHPQTKEASRLARPHLENSQVKFRLGPRLPIVMVPVGCVLWQQARHLYNCLAGNVPANLRRTAHTRPATKKLMPW